MDTYCASYVYISFDQCPFPSINWATSRIMMVHIQRESYRYRFAISNLSFDARCFKYTMNGHGVSMSWTQSMWRNTKKSISNICHYFSWLNNEEIEKHVGNLIPTLNFDGRLRQGKELRPDCLDWQVIVEIQFLFWEDFFSYVTTIFKTIPWTCWHSISVHIAMHCIL